MPKPRLLLLLVFVWTIIIACTDTSTDNAPKTTTPKTNTDEPTMLATGSSIINPNNFDVELLSGLLLEELNKLRAAKKLSALTPDNTLAKAANDQNSYITEKGKLSHNQPAAQKETVGKRVAYYGGSYQMVGENVQLWGFMVLTSGKKTIVEYTTYAQAAQGLLENWVSSKPHYENLVRKDFKLVGTAITFNKDKTGLYATQVYASYAVED